MGGPKYVNAQDDCSCNPCVGEECDKETPKQKEEQGKKVCMINPLIKCELNGCMAWCTSADGKSGQCLHGVFKQMMMQTIGSIAQMLSGSFGMVQPKKESNIVTPRPRI